jgi:hypothetical protein
MGRFNRRSACLLACTLSVSAIAGAQEPGGADAEARLLQRLAEAEERIRALEALVTRQSRRLEEHELSLAQAVAAAARTSGQDGSLEPTPEPAPPPAPADAPVPPPAPSPMAFPTFDGLVQAWYAAGNRMNDTFRVRRAEVYLNGQITDRARWQVMVDPAKALSFEPTPAAVGGLPPGTGLAPNQSTRILQNAMITFDYNPRVRVSVGQFKLPLSLEGQQSSGRLETVERALFLSDRARGGAYGDVRDVGLLVRAGVGTGVDIQAGLFNGLSESQNDVDGNDQKCVAASLVWRARPGLHVGASGAWGHPAPGERRRRDRLGTELQLTRPRFTLKSELMMGHDGSVTRRGYYGHVGWRLSPRVEAVLRLDSWDPDTRSEATPLAVVERDYVVGVNVLLSQHNLKLQANYLRKTFPSGRLGSRNLFLINSQAFW